MQDLVVFNRQSGRANRVNLPRVLAKVAFASHTPVVTLDELASLCPSDYTNVLVLGGDGTLRAVLQWAKNAALHIYYYACGTFNERKRALSNNGEHLVVGEVNDNLFTYVLATGIFTPIGYAVRAGTKQRIGGLAYLLQVLKEYRAYQIRAQITADDVSFSGEYALVMIIHSDTCFKLRFNRLYDPKKEGAHLLLLRSAGKDSLCARARLFFPLFRVFFLGLRHQHEGKSFSFREVHNVEISLDDTQPWAMDGEKFDYSHLSISFSTTPSTVQVVHKHQRQTAK